jgi:GTP-binding protein HflX
LPHSLISAFKATLEEVTYADLLLHIVDASYENHDFHIEVTDQVLKEIGVGDKEKLLVYNKIDLLLEKHVKSDEAAAIGIIGPGESISVSAKTGDGIDELIEKIKVKIFGDRVNAKFLIPYNKGDISSYLCEKAEVYSMEYNENGTFLDVCVTGADYSRLKQYEIKNGS